ncbi:hypothetical protein BCS71_07870 [Vibrio lentus]|uniref:hypothetical protein n=1 Tax=Vibrio TaxID=662 RepID=UPI000301F241|nr:MULTISPECIES: hypothetical protein [Vibrio]
MSNALRKELDKAVEASKNEEVIFKRAPKIAMRKAYRSVMKTHSKTIKELADR